MEFMRHESPAWLVWASMSFKDRHDFNIERSIENDLLPNTNRSLIHPITMISVFGFVNALNQLLKT